MKGCTVESFAYGGRCGEMGDGVCALMQNEQLAGGVIAMLEEAVKNQSMASLLHIYHAHRKGGYKSTKCLASQEICRIIGNELKKRGEEV